MLLFCLILARDLLVRGLIEELRHRNVIRVGVAYIVAGWLIAQVTDLAADAFNAPDWIMQMLIIVLLLGLPISLFLAWAYELTPEGMIKADEVPVDAPKDPRAGRVLNLVIIATLTVAVALLAWDKVRGPVLATENQSPYCRSTISARKAITHGLPMA